jgi:ribosomal protein L11 methyltransferase
LLAIAAAKALRDQVLASDIDALSVKVAAENARLNGVGQFVEVTWGNGFAAPKLRQRKPFDLVLANILANPLRQMATPMSRHLAGGARLILSGLLSAQAPAVIAAHRARGLIVERHIRIEGWSSLLLHKVC